MSGSRDLVATGTGGTAVANYGDYAPLSADRMDLSESVSFFRRQFMGMKQTAKAANVKFNFNNKEWQRWSRHSPKNNWRPGTDGLHTYIKKVETALRVAVS